MQHAEFNLKQLVQVSNSFLDFIQFSKDSLSVLRVLQQYLTKDFAKLYLQHCKINSAKMPAQATYNKTRFRSLLLALFFVFSHIIVYTDVCKTRIRQDLLRKTEKDPSSLWKLIAFIDLCLRKVLYDIWPVPFPNLIYTALGAVPENNAARNPHALGYAKND